MIVKKYNQINGYFLLDKPYGISSSQAVQKIRKIFNVQKIGHTGSLDPLATGMLPICIGKATKFSQYLMKSNKTYQVIAKLGEKTNTADSFGKIIKTRSINFNLKKYKKVIKKFLGQTFQIPPMYSAIKHNGKPLYKYAYKGISIKRKKRLIKIFKIKIIKIQKKFLNLIIKCSSGTYIRTIIEDIGEKLNCGAHVIFLRRLKILNLSYKNLITIKQLLFLKFQDKFLNTNNLFKKIILPINKLYIFLPTLKISSKIYNILKIKDIVKLNDNINFGNGFFKIFLKKNKKYLGIGKINKNNRLFFIK
ncbi:tRNA pseudouridine(55) synthase TruB [Buchnera aphidicola]|uniref:tRNA pseudouridine(55) synthase TruB n=1 Tax=Buchnera aphidicola TaxID=9 RepID=UPI0030EB2E54